MTLVYSYKLQKTFSQVVNTKDVVFPLQKSTISTYLFAPKSNNQNGNTQLCFNFELCKVLINKIQRLNEFIDNDEKVFMLYSIRDHLSLADPFPTPQGLIKETGNDHHIVCELGFPTSPTLIMPKK